MDAGAYLQLCVGFVRDLESVADTDQIKSHAGYLSSMIDAIFLRDPRDHHVWKISQYSMTRDRKRKRDALDESVVFAFLNS